MPVAAVGARANNGSMGENFRFVLGIVIVLLLLAVAAWYFNPSSPEICLDGRCYDLP